MNEINNRRSFELIKESGKPKYEGIGAIFAENDNGEITEFVIVAPSLETLDRVIRKLKVTHDVDITKCKELTIIPTTTGKQETN